MALSRYSEMKEKIVFSDTGKYQRFRDISILFEMSQKKRVEGREKKKKKTAPLRWRKKGDIREEKFVVI